MPPPIKFVIDLYRKDVVGVKGEGWKEDKMTPEQLCQDWLEAKAAENSAKAKREEIEAQLLDHVKAKPEGSATTKLEGFKVTTTGRINRRVDEGEWMAVRGQIDARLWPAKHKLVVDDRGVKWLQDNDPDVWLKVSEAFMSTPGRTAVKVEKQ